MLVLSRKVGQKLVIDGKITIIVNRVAGNRVSLGIEAPPDVHVIRGELKSFVDEFRSPEFDAVPLDDVDHEPMLACVSGVESTFELALPVAAR